MGDLDSKQHHWWPLSLLEHWLAEDGKLTQFFADGRVERSGLGGIGTKTDKANHILPGDPWNTTFELDFKEADEGMASLVAWISTIQSQRNQSARMAAVPLSTIERRRLAECTASLIVRSPALRSAIKTGIEELQSSFGAPMPKVSKTLVAANATGLLQEISACMRQSGRFALLFGNHREFIFGDGLLSTFPWVKPVRVSQATAVVPLLPTATVVYCKEPIMRTEPPLVSVGLGNDEVEFFNQLVQIYSKRTVFARAAVPTLTEHFTRGEHLELPYHHDPYLDGLLRQIASFRS